MALYFVQCELHDNVGEPAIAVTSFAIEHPLVCSEIEYDQLLIAIGEGIERHRGSAYGGHVVVNTVNVLDSTNRPAQIPQDLMPQSQADAVFDAAVVTALRSMTAERRAHVYSLANRS